MTDGSLNLTSYRAALGSLREAVAVTDDRAWLDRQPTGVRNTLIAGLIQNFEFVYELGVKMIKRRIELDSLNPAEADQLSYRDLMRVAGEAGLVDDVVAWFGFREMRNITAHTYDPVKAARIRDEVPAFLGAAESLLARLQARNG